MISAAATPTASAIRTQVCGAVMKIFHPSPHHASAWPASSDRGSRRRGPPGADEAEAAEGNAWGNGGLSSMVGSLRIGG